MILSARAYRRLRLVLEVFADLLTFRRRSDRETYRHLLWAVANPTFYSHLKAVDGSVGVQGREVSVAPLQTSPERVGLFSDAVFAVIITILVLRAQAAERRYLQCPATAAALTGLSYAVSYVFIAIVWVNHHHLFSYAQVATPRLVWSNFAHLFSVSLIPFTTGWIADSRLAAAPVAMYAAIFVLVNITYIALCWEVVD